MAHGSGEKLNLCMPDAYKCKIAESYRGIRHVLTLLLKRSVFADKLITFDDFPRDSNASFYRRNVFQFFLHLAERCREVAMKPVHPPRGSAAAANGEDGSSKKKKKKKKKKKRKRGGEDEDDEAEEEEEEPAAEDEEEETVPGEGEEDMFGGSTPSTPPPPLEPQEGGEDDLFSTLGNTIATDAEDHMEVREDEQGMPHVGSFQEPLWMFLESRMKEIPEEERGRPLSTSHRDEVLEYMFVLCINSPKIDPNVVGLTILMENEFNHWGTNRLLSMPTAPGTGSDGSAAPAPRGGFGGGGGAPGSGFAPGADQGGGGPSSMGRGRGRGGPRSYLPFLNRDRGMAPHEQWRKINNLQMWCNTASNYIRDQNTISGNVDVVSNVSVGSPSNPACMTNVFNPVFAALNESHGLAEPQRGHHFLNGYFTREEDGTWTLRFPLRKYVTRIPLMEISCANLYNRVVPSYEKDKILRMAQQLPRLVAESRMLTQEEEERSKELTEKTKRSAGALAVRAHRERQAEQEDDVERGLDDLLAPSSSSSSSSLPSMEDRAAAVDDLLQRRQLTQLENGMREFRLSEGTTRAEELELQDQLQTLSLREDPHSSPRAEGEAQPSPSGRSRLGHGGAQVTRREMVGQLAAAFGVVGFDVGRIRNFSRENLPNEKALQAAGQLLASPNVEANYASMLSSSRLQGRDNLDFIKGKVMSDSPYHIGAKLQQKRYVARKLYLMHQEIAMRAHQEWCGDATEQSPAEQCILRYVDNTRLFRNHDVALEKIDGSLSHFASNEACLYLYYEHFDFLNSSHREASLIERAAYDAFCMDFDRIHQHTLSQSETGGTGKTHLWNCLMRKWTIPDTVTMQNYQTLRANATDERNQNAQVIVMDELEKEQFDKDGTGDKERSFKMLLSANKMIIRTLIIDDEGRRKTKVTYSECITVYFGSTNMDLSCMSQAMKRRFYITYFDQRYGHSRSILELQLTEEMLSEREKVMETKLNRHKCRLSAMMLKTERMIYGQVLQDVSMDVCSLIILYLVNALQAKGVRDPDPSMVRRVKTHARVLAIVDALGKVFFYKGAPCQEKNSVAEEDFLRLDRHLFTTREHTVSAVAEMLDVFVDSADTIVKKALKYLFDETPPDNRYRRTWRKYVTYVQTPQGVISKPGSVSDDDPNYAQFSVMPHKRFLVDRIFHTYDLLAKEIPYKPSRQQTGNILHSWAELKVSSRMWINKNTLKVKKEALSTEIEELASSVVKDNESLKFGEVELKAMEDQGDYGEDYDQKVKEFGHLQLRVKLNNAQLENMQKRAHALDREIDSRLGLPATTPFEDASSAEKLRPVVDLDARYMYVHTKWIGESATDSPETTVSKILTTLFSHRFQLPGRFIWVPHPNDPHVRTVLEVHGPPDPANAPLLAIPLVSSVGKEELALLGGAAQYISESRQQQELVIDFNLDTMGVNKRNERLCLTDPRDSRNFRVSRESLSVVENLFQWDAGASASASASSPHRRYPGYQTDEDYDEMECGYFMGTPVDTLLADPKTLVSRMTDEEKDEVMARLDAYERPDPPRFYRVVQRLKEQLEAAGLSERSPDYMPTLELYLRHYDLSAHENDVDFDPSDFLVRECVLEVPARQKRAAENAAGGPDFPPLLQRAYHWDILGPPFRSAEREVDQFLHISRLSSSSSSSSSLGPMGEPRDAMVLSSVSEERAREDAYVQTLSPEMRTLKEMFELRVSAWDANVSSYKLICVHPKVMDSLAQSRFYDTPEAKARERTYPTAALRKLRETRAERSARLADFGSNPEKLVEAVKNRTAALYTLRLNEQGHVERDLGNPLALVDTLFGDSRSNIFRVPEPPSAPTSQLRKSRATPPPPLSPSSSSRAWGMTLGASMSSEDDLSGMSSAAEDDGNNMELARNSTGEHEDEETEISMVEDGDEDDMDPFTIFMPTAAPAKKPVATGNRGFAYAQRA